MLLIAAIFQRNLIYKGKASIYAGYHASDDVKVVDVSYHVQEREAENADHYAGKSKAS